MKTYTQEQLNEIIADHQLWLNDEGGKRADIRNSDFSFLDFSGSNLSDCNLSDCNLSGSAFRGSAFREAKGDMNHIKSIFIETYPIVYTFEILQIDCERHDISAWWEFSDERIIEMEGKKALKFWRKYKDFIKMTIELSPAKPTKNK